MIPCLSIIFWQKCIFCSTESVLFRKGFFCENCRYLAFRAADSRRCQKNFKRLPSFQQPTPLKSRHLGGVVDTIPKNQKTKTSSPARPRFPAPRCWAAAQ